MRQVFIMRHAAAESNNIIEDKLRSLSFQGKGELQRVVADRVGLFDEVTCVLCSSSIRTRQTLDGIQEILSPTADVHYLDRLYLAPAYAILEELTLVNDKHQSVLVVGHNPGISHFLFDVLKHEQKPMLGSMPTSAISYFRANCQKWQDLKVPSLSFQGAFVA